MPSSLTKAQKKTKQSRKVIKGQPVKRTRKLKKETGSGVVRG